MTVWSSELRFLSLNAWFQLCSLPFCSWEYNSMEAFHGKITTLKGIRLGPFQPFSGQNFVASADISSFFSFSWDRGCFGGSCSGAVCWKMNWWLQMGRSWIFYRRALINCSSLREAAAVTSLFLLDFQTCWEPTVRATVQRQLLPCLSVVLLIWLIAIQKTKNTNMWPTRFPKPKRLMPVKDLVATIWGWQALT